MREVKTIFSFQAKDGMVLAADVYSISGQMLVNKNTSVNERVRQIFKLYNIQQIAIYEGEEDADAPAPPKASAEQENSLTYSERIKSSVEFKKFGENFSKSLQNFEQELNNAVADTSNINPKKLLQNTMSVIPKGTSTIGIFDMLHNLKTYDDSTFSHSLNVSVMCYVFGEWLHMDQDELEILSVAGLLHDIGKLLVDEHIIKKPERLTPIEYNIVQSHPQLGYNLIKDTKLDPHIKNAILMHHERYDGTGYPSKLAGDQIDYFAKIVAIADVYDAMTSKRVYRGALCPFEVIRAFEKEGFQKYDPKLILTFLNGIGQTYINNYVRLSDGRKGKIVLLNPNDLAKPMIQSGKKYIDLSKEHDVYIESIL